MKKGIWYAYKAFTPLANSSLALSFYRVRSVLKYSWCGLSKCFLAAFLSLGGYVVFYITVQWLPVVSWLSLTSDHQRKMLMILIFGSLTFRVCFHSFLGSDLLF